MSDSEKLAAAKVVSIHPETGESAIVLDVLRQVMAKLGELENKVDRGRDALVVLTEKADRSHRELAKRIDDLRVETEVLAQAAMLGRLDAEKAERVAEWAIRQRDEAQAALENAPTESPTNGNGRYSSAPPPKDA